MLESLLKTPKWQVNYTRSNYDCLCGLYLTYLSFRRASCYHLFVFRSGFDRRRSYLLFYIKAGPPFQAKYLLKSLLSVSIRLMLGAATLGSAPQSSGPGIPALSRLPASRFAIQMKAFGVTIITWLSRTVAYLPEALPLTTIPLNLAPFICFKDP